MMPAFFILISPALFSFVLPIVIFYFIFPSVKKSFLNGTTSLLMSMISIFVQLQVLVWLIPLIFGFFFGKQIGLNGVPFLVVMCTVLPLVSFVLVVVTFLKLRGLQTNVVTVTDSKQSGISKIVRYVEIIIIIGTLLYFLLSLSF